MKIDEQKHMISECFKKLSCRDMNENDELKKEEDILTEFTKTIHLQLEADDFNLSIMNTFASWKCSLEKLQSEKEVLVQEISEAAKAYRGIIMVAEYTGELDDEVVQNSLQKFAKIVETL